MPRTQGKSKAKSVNIKIQFFRSTICCPETHKVLVRSLGLTKLNQIVERPDTPAMRGAVAKVPHLLRIID